MQFNEGRPRSAAPTMIQVGRHAWMTVGAALRGPPVVELNLLSLFFEIEAGDFELGKAADFAGFEGVR
jgi:hypothetical protein